MGIAWRKTVRAALPTLAALILCQMVSVGMVATAAMAPVPGDPVTTRNGKISGTLLPSGVRAYLGVPYAKPPLGDLRWAAPQPIHWDGIWNADRFGPECIQVLRPHDINHYFGEEATSEDCLYLNVWVPPGTVPSAKLPVIAFIYGGGGTVGSSGMPVYSGEPMAERGAIFVNFNYRIGILGFLAHPELTREQGGHSGNYGYLDQNAALHWIQDNIAAFGGDPSKVILTGQSFGAGSVAAQLFSPLSRGLFRGAAMWSACNFTSAAVPLATAEAVGEEVQKRLGVDSLSRLRNVPADRILAVQEEHQLGANVRGVRLPATVDGLFWTQGKQATLEAHEFNDVPLVAGSNGDDLDASRSPLTMATSLAELQATAEKMYGTQAPEFLRLFPVRSDAEVAAVAHEAALENGFLEDSRNCASLQAKYNRSAAYVEIFAHKHPYEPGVVIADQNPLTVGAYHTADVPYWFGTLDAFNLRRTTRRWTASDRSLSNDMSAALIAFAQTGSPSTAAIPWPQWTPKRPAFLVIGDTVTVNTMHVQRMDWLAAHPAAEVERGGSPRPTRD
jgi:para-nitrobenzyl esterase